MNFPKPIMSTSELIKAGYFSEAQLYQLAHRAGQNYAFRITPRGKWNWNTERLQRYLDRHPFGR